MQATADLVSPTIARIEQLPQLLEQMQIRKWVYVSDHQVAPLLRGRVPACGLPEVSSGPVQLQQGWLTVPAGEASKQIETAIHIWNCLAAAAIDRQWAVIAVGGGMVGDLSGFAASTYLRGLTLLQIPTSLLAMVDSSIGGKVGIDLPAGKNLVGSFWPARLILTDPSLLFTLPAGEWSNGMAEVIKHAVLDGPEHLAWLENLDPKEVKASVQPQQESQDLFSGLAHQLVERSLQVKVEVVRQDPYEKGIRAHLNFGHTLGHALEQALGFEQLSHGQAVALGMLAATRLAISKGLCEEALYQQIHHLLTRWGLPTGWALPEKPPWETVSAALLRDKKNQNGQVRFILPLGLNNGQRGMRLEAIPLDQIHPLYQNL